MENLTENIHIVFSIFLFCVALTVLALFNHNYNMSLNAAKKINKNHVMYEQNININDECIVKKGKIISELLDDPLEYDIEIDGFLISKSENTRENIENYKIDHDIYKKSYAYDSNGNVTRIIFKGI